MNKTQIKEALEIRKQNKINLIIESESTARGILLQKEINDNVGLLLKDIEKFLNNISGRNKLEKMVAELIEKIEKTNDLEFENSYSVKMFEYFIKSGFYESIYFGWRNENANKLKKDKNAMISNVEKEYEKLYRLLTTMSADKFYAYLIEKGINLEIKETEKSNLPSIEINMNFI